MTEAEQNAITGHSLVLYDGVCGLCNHVVQFILRVDHSKKFLFAPLESTMASEVLASFPASPGEPEGVILIVNALTPHAQIFRRSNAVNEALVRLNSPYRQLGKLLRLLPNLLREWGYGLVARYRYRLFGKYDTCPIPTQAQRSRILGM